MFYFQSLPALFVLLHFPEVMHAFYHTRGEELLSYAVFTVLVPGLIFFATVTSQEAVYEAHEEISVLKKLAVSIAILNVVLNLYLVPFAGIFGSACATTISMFAYFMAFDIQKNIEEKKLKDQLVFKNQAEARAAIEEAKLKKIEQEGKVVVAVEMEKGKAYVTRKIAEKDLYVRKKKAEADLRVQLAEAEKVRLKNEALKGLGAERTVGLKMADAYRGLELVVLPSDGPAGVNPLNLDKALKLFDVRKGGAQ